MHIRINDLGAHIGDDNKLHSIGQTAILIEWMEENTVLYRMLLDMGVRLDGAFLNISRIKDIFEDKVLGFNSGIQAMTLSHCHEDHAGGYPWFYQYCKNKKTPVDAIPKLYMTKITWRQFIPFQDELYDLFVKPAEGKWYYWDKSIINEIGAFKDDKNYWDYMNVTPKPHDFDIRLRFIPAGHIVGSTMTEIDTIKNGTSIGKILFTGDVCFRDGGFLVDPINTQLIKDAYKCVIMEGTYIRNREDKYKKLQRPQLKNNLKNKIIDTLSKGGNLVLLVYGIDRTANILVALREIIEEGINIDLKGKIFLDTKIGSTITDTYIKEFEGFIKYAGTSEQYFRKELGNRYNNGLGPSMMQLSKDKSNIYEYIGSIDRRNELINKFKNGSCIVVATSATLEGGTALISGSYMHPSGWGSDKKNLFLIVGGAIPSTSASRAVKQFKDTNNTYADIEYQEYEITDKGFTWLPKQTLRFTSRLDNLSEFSAHANFDELVNFKQSIISEKFIITHIGGNSSPQTAQIYMNNTFMSGVKRNANITSRGDVAILDGEHKIIISLEDNGNNLPMDKETYKMLRIFCINEKGDYSVKIANDSIKKLITEHNQIKSQNL